MFDIKWIRENPDAFDDGAKKRNLKDVRAADLVALDDARRAHVARLQDAQTRRNSASKEIGGAMASGETEKADRLKAEVAELKESMALLERAAAEADAALTGALEVIPNLPLGDVPVGEDEEANAEHTISGQKPHFAFTPKQHFEIGEALGQMDFETAAKLAGSRFTVLSGDLARLERALGQFMTDLHVEEHGYTEVSPPLLVNDRTVYGTGQLPKFAEDLFRTAGVYQEADVRVGTQPGTVVIGSGGSSNQDSARVEREFKLSHPRVEGGKLSGVKVKKELWLIPTAEVPLTNLVAGEIVEAGTLPRRYTALTPCFRSEAGSAGKDTRGMLRQHQFWKCELVSVTEPDKSLEEHERMLACAEEVLKRLGLHYRVMVLSTGDMGFGARKTYDIEVWLPGQGAYREISSCSVCGDFQARRMNARYRKDDGRSLGFVHTLNGSGVAVGRALIAVLENYQDQDGNVAIPDVLHDYMGGRKRIGKAG